MDLLARSSVGRDINRHYYKPEEIKEALSKSLVQKQIELIKLRNSHPAFGGEVRIKIPKEHEIEIKWSLEKQWIKLHVDLSAPSASVTGTSDTGELSMVFSD